MTDYIQEIQKQLISKYGFKEHPDKPNVPMDVPDGDYPMNVDGKIDNVRVVGGFIECGRFEPFYTICDGESMNIPVQDAELRQSVAKAEQGAHISRREP